MWYEAAFKKGNIMNQERKNYLAQFIMSVFCESADYIWRDVYYFRSTNLVSDSLKNHNLPRFIVKNVKFSKICAFFVIFFITFSLPGFSIIYLSFNFLLFN